jgi:signal transduction histidine kinase
MDRRSQSEASSGFTSAASVFLIALGALVLAGWTFDLGVLKGVAGNITMKANASIGLLLMGLALRWLGSGSPRTRTAGRICASAGGVLGALTFSEHIVGWNLGIDELLFVEAPGAVATLSPGRMGQNASLSLTLGAIALLSLSGSTPRAIVVGQGLAACMTVLGLVPTVGYFYGVPALYASRYTGIALHTGVALVVLSLGILAARPHAGPVAVLTNPGPTGVMAWRLLAAAILVPLVLGYVRLEGERRGLYESGLGTSLFVVSMIVLLSLLIWWIVAALERSEDAREAAQRDRDELLVRERAARENAERADRAKDEFIAMISHELRTPLNAILGWMQMLRQGAIAGEAQAKATDAVARNAGVLSRLIEDLLDTSRIVTGHLELSRAPLDIRAIVQAAVESVMPAAKSRGVHVGLAAGPALPTVSGDGQRIQQIVWNLVSNAIKFSPAGAHVEVRVSTAPGTVVISVRDEGQGIDPAFLPHVFDRFRQAEGTRTRGGGGLGLGLFIAKTLTDLHGGSIRAHSDGPGRGALFEVALPVAVF